jgi:hypothetical protein
MANQGFVQTLNLAEVTNGTQLIQNLAGGNIDQDLRLFAGLSTRKSSLFWNRFRNNSQNIKSQKLLREGTQFQWNTDFTYTDDDYVYAIPINLIRDIDSIYIGFDRDGTLLENSSGIDIVYDRGEDYFPGTYNLSLTGGSGSDAKAEIIVDANGNVSSVRITDNGDGYFNGDILQANIPGGGTGFALRIVCFPWKVVLVGNYAFDISTLDTASLSIAVSNTSDSLNGTYNIEKNLNTGVNTWGLPNSAATKAFDVNRKIYAQEKILKNIELYDITGDGQLTQYDVELMNEFYNNNRDLNWFINYVNANPTPAGSSRNNGTRVYNYLTGLETSVFDVDGTGEFSFDYNLLTEYVTNGGYLYQRPAAASLIAATEVNSNGVAHVISVSFRAPQNPGYTLPQNLDDEYKRPYFILFKTISNQVINHFDNFSKYGTLQVGETNETTYLSISIGSTNVANGVEYNIIDKYTSFIDNVQHYYIKIVAQGLGFALNSTQNNLLIIKSTPVFSSTTEYGVFDSNGVDSYFLVDNPRSNDETDKELITFFTKYEVTTNESLSYANIIVPTTVLVPDLLFERNDGLELFNIENLEPPIITDNGLNDFTNTGGFSYDVRDGYSTELNRITNNVDQSSFLRTTKYRIDRNLYYQKEININGLLTSFDPDGLNAVQTDLELDNSPGIYISSALSQTTNPLAADFAQKTRSFSSYFNPWKAFPESQELRTESFNVTINDLVWTTEIKLDINNGFKSSGLSESLNDNFNSSLLSQGKSFKLKTLINGEEFYIIMRKP